MYERQLISDYKSGKSLELLSVVYGVNIRDIICIIYADVIDRRNSFMAKINKLKG